MDRPTYRVRYFPREYQSEHVSSVIQKIPELRSSGNLEIHSLSLDLPSSGDPKRQQVATVTFTTKPPKLADDSEKEWEFWIPSVLGTYKQPIHPYFNIRFDGLTPLTPTQNDANCTIECIFIHGWGAHALGSVIPRGTTYAWLRDDIKKRFPALRAWTYGYGSKLNDPNSVSEIDDFADRLKSSLTSFLNDAERSPTRFIFIVHSLGGIVFKEAIKSMAESGNDLDKKILKQIIGALFFGVPSQGLDGNALKALVEDNPSQAILDLLDQETGSQFLENLDEDFSRVCQFRVIQFRELVKTPTAVKKSDGVGIEWTGEPTLLVTRESATSCRAGRRNTDDIASINKNHRDMLKFSPNDVEDYERLCKYLKQLMNNESGIVTQSHEQAQSKLFVQSDAYSSWEAYTFGARYQLRPKPLGKFIGRKKFLQELGRNVLNKGVQRLAIVGSGGVGKTRLVLEFCYLVKEQYPSYSIFWVSASSSQLFKQDYIKLAKSCIPAIDPSKDDTVSLLQRYLGSKSAGKWILVVDNADDNALLFDGDDAIYSKLPTHSEAGVVLFTTRNEDVARRLKVSETLVLKEMDPKEGQEFLRNRLGDRSPPQNESISLLEKLGYMPLAIVQACSYIIKEHVTISEYLDRLEKTTGNLSSGAFQEVVHGGGTGKPIAKTWFINFEQIRQKEPEAADILFFTSFLESKNIPLSLLSKTSKMWSHIEVLKGYSLLSVHEAQDTYEMQESAHCAVKIWMENEGYTNNWAQITVGRLATMFPSNQWENRSLWQKYVPHAIQALQNIKQTKLEWEALRERATLCLKLGLCLNEDGRTSEAVKWISECVLWRDRKLPENSSETLFARRCLGHAYTSNHEKDKAIDLLEEVVKIREGMFEVEDGMFKVQEGKLKEEDFDRLSTQHELARAYIYDDKAPDAVPILEDVVAKRRSLLEEDNPDRLKSEHALGKAWLVTGKTEDAIRLLENVVSIRERVLPKTHPHLLKSQRQLGTAYLKAGRLDAAIRLLKEVVEIREQVLTEDHPNLLVAQNQLAKAYIEENEEHEKNKDHLKDAVRMLEKVVDRRSKVFPQDDRDLADSRQLLFRARELVRLHGDSIVSRQTAPSRPESSRANHSGRSGAKHGPPLPPRPARER